MSGSIRWTAPPSRHHKAPPPVGPLPQTMEVMPGNQLYIAKEGLNPGLRDRLRRLAAFQNPEFYKAQVMRLSTYGKPRTIACAARKRGFEPNDSSHDLNAAHALQPQTCGDREHELVAGVPWSRPRLWRHCGDALPLDGVLEKASH